MNDRQPMARPKSENKSKKIPISFTESLHESIIKAALMDGLTFPAYIKRLVHLDLLKKGIIKEVDNRISVSQLPDKQA